MRQPSRLWLAAELLVVFVGLPWLLLRLWDSFGNWFFLILVALAVAMVSVLVADPSFRPRWLWNYRKLDWQPFGRFLPGGIALSLLIWIVWPERFLDLPREEPKLWFVFVVCYPIFSVYPQEVIFRAYFCHRYERLFGPVWLLVVANAAAFAWAHIIFGNWVAPLLTFFGGLLFASSFRRTSSLAVCCMEHALWGLLVLSVGLGEFFLGATVDRLREFLG